MEEFIETADNTSFIEPIVEDITATATSTVPANFEDDEDEMGELNIKDTAEGVDLGFIDGKLVDPEDTEIEGPWNIWDSGKTGGKPRWLNPKELPAAADLKCSNCSKLMLHLLQLYIPREESEDAFHRSLYVFTCMNGKCLPKGGMKAFRCQLPEKNEYIPVEALDGTDMDRSSMFTDNWGVNTCVVCGSSAQSHCAKCKDTHYCSREHQVMHWKKGSHKLECGNTKVESATDALTSDVVACGNLLLLPELEISLDAEPSLSEREAVGLAETEKLLNEFKVSDRVEDTANDISGKEVAEATQTLPDKPDVYFNYFNTRITAAKEQCLRLASTTHGNDAVLWVCTLNQPKPDGSSIEDCPYCGGKRAFEFQLLPQFLHYLNINTTTGGCDASSLDWATVAIYTCTNNCSGGPAYKNEAIWFQPMAFEK